MSIRTIAAIKKAEESAITMVKEAQKEADRQVDQVKKQKEEQQQKKMDETLLLEQEILLRAREKAKIRCLELEQENQYDLEKYENPSKNNVEKAVNLVVKRVLMYGN